MCDTYCLACLACRFAGGGYSDERARRANQFDFTAISSRENTLQARKWHARKIDFHETFQADLGRPVLARKTFRFSSTPNQWLLLAIPPQSEGRTRDRHEA